MTAKTYIASGLFETGTETATFPKTRKGLQAAYDWVYNACSWQILCNGDIVDEFDAWANDEKEQFPVDSASLPICFDKIMTRAILVDPFIPAIKIVKVGDFRDIQRQIGCDVFSTVRFPDGKHIAYVDDEGLINGTKRAVRFVDEVYPSPLAGRVLILGDDGFGGDVDCKLTGEDVRALVKNILEIF